MTPEDFNKLMTRWHRDVLTDANVHASDTWQESVGKIARHVDFRSIKSDENIDKVLEELWVFI